MKDLYKRVIIEKNQTIDNLERELFWWRLLYITTSVMLIIYL